MNLQNIFDEIEKVDPEIYGRLDNRRDVIKNITSFGSKVALAALPFAMGTMFKKAYGQTTSRSVVDVLNFALTLEYLEATFYDTGYAQAGLIASADAPSIMSIRDDEDAHVIFLTNAIKGAGGTPVVFDKSTSNNKNFDFTAQGTFPTVFTDYNIFLAVAETFEDTGVRAYKGQAPFLLRGGDVLTAALSIHSVEARHASKVRQIRRMRGANIKPWITGANDTGLAVVNASYAGEDNVMQGGADVTKLPAVSGTTSVNAATESFDEPLDTNAVLAIVKPFFK